MRRRFEQRFPARPAALTGHFARVGSRRAVYILAGCTCPAWLFRSRKEEAPQRPLSFAYTLQFFMCTLGRHRVNALPPPLSAVADSLKIRRLCAVQISDLRTRCKEKTGCAMQD